MKPSWRTAAAESPPPTTERPSTSVSACAVVARGTYVFALPGSTGAVKDGWDDILVHQLDSRFQPCNFVELMPRLREV